MTILNVSSDGMGRWAYNIIEPLLKRTFPHTEIVFDKENVNPDLVILSHFKDNENRPFKCNYISWSPESYRVSPKKGLAPLFEINTAYHSSKNSIYIPHLVQEIPHTTKPSTDDMEALPRKYCLAYTYRNCVPEREILFKYMRQSEPRCYSFGSSLRTYDNPFIVDSRDNRFTANSSAFREFAFVVAMENKVVPGYLSEKIGYAIMNGVVPIYWGDSSTVSDFFNPAGYLDVNDYGGPERAALAAINIWKDQHKLVPYLEAPMTLNNRLADYEAIYTEYRPWQKPMVDILRDTFPDLS
jgi:hypothetical protein